MLLRAELLEILACPQCKRRVKMTADETYIECENCRLHFPIRDNIPVMLIDEAQSY